MNNGFDPYAPAAPLPAGVPVRKSPRQRGLDKATRRAKKELADSFARNLRDDFVQYGREAIVRAREENPLGYLQVVQRTLPVELPVSEDGAPMILISFTGTRADQGYAALESAQGETWPVEDPEEGDEPELEAEAELEFDQDPETDNPW
jgi:hypothetical protein